MQEDILTDMFMYIYVIVCISVEVPPVFLCVVCVCIYVSRMVCGSIPTTTSIYIYILNGCGGKI